ncbi:hypothetical protein SAMN04487785_10875 [Dyella jiangningensis]|nr:hypothetical protein [Dyella sp. AtDHG13]PXV55926.1 hypothetical protein BDW41_110123 [Dyella sp. AtDHG13]SDK50517.1 hypothetical protein SAMN04487785_10875 [Dyella jiangningensis]
METVLAEGDRVDSLSWRTKGNLPAACAMRVNGSEKLIEMPGLI